MRSGSRNQRISPRLQSLGTLTVSDRLKTALWERGLDTIEDVLRWRHGSTVASDFPRDHRDELDRALTAIGLFRAMPLPLRNWDIYNRRRRGATFSSLAKTYSLSPAGARVAFYKVKQILESEMKIGKVFGGELATKVEDLPLPTRAKFGLQRGNVFTLANLLITPPETILQMRGLGVTSLEAIRDLQMQFAQSPGAKF